MLVCSGKARKTFALVAAVLCLWTYSYFEFESWTDSYLHQIKSGHNGVTTPQERDDSANHFDNALAPRIVWLMSFPNSGSSFTLHNTRMVTNHTFATNYPPKGQDPQPIYPSRKGGPFWIDKKRLPPTKYVLTKTHCGFFVVYDGPRSYVGTVNSFAARCARGRLLSGKEKPDIVWYPPQLAKKAVHLVRNPYDNIVSRFRFELDYGEASLSARYPKNATGFQSWCQDLDARFAKADEFVFGKDPAMHKRLKDVPCHGDFFKYVQWHNLAYETQAMLDIPALVIHYEDYEHDFNNTVAKLMQFLEETPKGEARDFSPGHSYGGFYSEEQRLAIKVLVRKLASNQTWVQLERYFQGEKRLTDSDQIV